MKSLSVLVLFMIMSIILGKGYWKSRAATFTILALFAFLQAAFVLMEMYLMKPPTP